MISDLYISMATDQGITRDAAVGTSGIKPWQAPTPALALEESWEDNRLPQWPPDWPFRSGGMGMGADDAADVSGALSELYGSSGGGGGGD